MSVQLVRFVVKHTVASAIVTAAVLAFTVISYFALLLWAAFAGGGLGSPVVLPIFLLLALAGSVSCALIVFLPISLVAEYICIQRMRWGRFAEIPVSIVLLSLVVLITSSTVSLFNGWALWTALAVGAICLAVLLAPLGVYWWCLQSTDLLLGVGIKLWNGRSAKSREASKNVMAG